MRRIFRYVTSLIVASFFAGSVLLWLVSSRQSVAPVEITFLGHTNYHGRIIALFGITNHEARDLRGFAYVQTNTSAGWPAIGVRPITHRTIVQTAGGPVMSNFQVWAISQAYELPRYEHRRDIWLGAELKAPHNAMMFGIPEPATTNSWKLALFFPVVRWTNAPTLRDRWADYCFQKGHVRLAKRLKPAASQPVFVYGPEMTSDSRRMQ